MRHVKPVTVAKANVEKDDWNTFWNDIGTNWNNFWGKSNYSK